ncbi:MAG: ABC transporter permease [Candidatus Methanofastidiosia archaeon]|jgi:peptide/nickel transport system permease protein
MKFLSYTTRWVIGCIITIFLVMSILFILLHSVPGGDPVTRLFPFASGEQKDQIREMWGLTRPLYHQYLIYMKKVFTFDYRILYAQEHDALDYLLFYLPYTILLFGTATILSYGIGAFLGVKLFSKKGFSTQFVTGITILLYAVPAFVLAVYSKTWLVFTHHIFPPVSAYPEFEPGITILGHITNMRALLPGMVLPLIVLVLVGLARPLFLLKDQMAVVASEPFVTTAKAKGLPDSAVTFKHIARCAFLPLLNDASINVSLIISGGILIEYIFGWPGIGTILFFALKFLNYSVISAAIFLLTVILLVSMMIVDILNQYYDPRVSL